MPKICHQNQTYDIPETVLDNHLDLVNLLLNSAAMRYARKSKNPQKSDSPQYWFLLLPFMTSKQVDKLRNICLRERKKMTAIDRQYGTKLAQIENIAF